MEVFKIWVVFFNYCDGCVRRQTASVASAGAMNLVLDAFWYEKQRAREQEKEEMCHVQKITKTENVFLKSVIFGGNFMTHWQDFFLELAVWVL